MTNSANVPFFFRKVTEPVNRIQMAEQHFHYIKKKEVIAGLTGDFELSDYGHMRHSNAKFSKRGNLEQMLCFINVRHYVKVKLSKRS